LYRAGLVHLQKDACDIIGECNWGQAATFNFIANMMYLGASILQCCLPTPAETRANRRADQAEKKAEDAEARAAEAEKKAAEAEAKVNDDTNTGGGATIPAQTE
jgi:hypothetical protein